MLAKVAFTLFILVLLVTALAFLVSPPTAWPLGSELVLPGPPRYSFLDIKARMEYHGVKVAWHDEKGQWWFIRAGKPCRLSAVGGI